MNRNWEAHTNLKDGYSRIVFEDGEEITVKNDGITGFSFVEEYLEEMRRNYPSHLQAAEMKLQMRLGKNYKAIKAIPRRYMAEIALISLNCCFGREDNIPDHEGRDDFNPEFTLCPERYNCPFNGFNPAFRNKKLVCCNPILEIGLTQTQAEVANLMVNTPLSYEEIADKMECSYSNIDNLRKRIFAVTGVTTRAELMVVLKGKRLV
jgi:DNA-binding CsgD family transcriptional regulator